MIKYAQGMGMYQGEMRLSAGDSIAYMNQKTRHGLACAVNESRWHETIKTVSDAIAWASDCEQHDIQDVYVSDNAFDQWRNCTNLRQITRLAVDIDHYKGPYAHLEAIELWELIKRENPWLPTPTIIEDSGRGAYLKWKFTRPLPITPQTRRFNFPAQWQICQDFLADRLKPYGADSKASDVTRVLRVSGTINSANMARARAWTCGPEYEFKDIKKALTDEYKRTKPKPKPTTRKAHSPIERLFNWHSLAWSRLKDLERLAELRGGRLTDNRRRAIFVYAVESCHFVRSVERLQVDVARFVERYIADPNRYNPFEGRKVHLKEVVRRFEAQESRGHWEWHESPSTGKYGADNRYLLKTSTIIDQLGITASEQRHMKALVGDKEKYRRKVKKRRESGIVERSEYLATAKHRKASARRLKSEGMSTTAIAEQLGVNARTVRNYLR